MFEDQQPEKMEALFRSHAEFRRLYHHHKKLDSKVHDAEIGALPMDAATLSGMKQEKLKAKEQLQRMWEEIERSEATS